VRGVVPRCEPLILTTAPGGRELIVTVSVDHLKTVAQLVRTKLQTAIQIGRIASDRIFTTNAPDVNIEE
jgi:hypothetical protein